VAEDHGLCDGYGPVDVTEGVELLFAAVAQDIVLLDGVQRLLFSLQLDNVGVGDNFLGKLPHRVLKGGREQQHLAIFGKHPEGSQKGNKDLDLFGSTSNQASKVHNPYGHFTLTLLWIKLAHLFNHFSGLKSQFICWRKAKTLEERREREKVVSGLLIGRK
uniref:Uncharacterized protein n=1 Tax=Salvator merianae TaxID=96440 RepID=A0A8D0BM96_SALMN